MLRHRCALVSAVLCLLGVESQAQQLETTRDVNLRKGPSTSSQIITVIDSGTAVDPLMRRTGWDRVQTPSC